jgi:long-chain fatty acid transport protein
LYPTPAAGLARAADIRNDNKKDTTITTPQSVNLDFQTGIMANTVAFANLRWVNWKDFSIQPYQFGLFAKEVGPAVNRPDGFNLVEYSDDQWSVNAGVGRKLSEQWAGNVSVGWDSGAGNPVTTLGPTEGYWNLGLGVQYSPTPATFIAGGVKYFWLGDAKAQTGAQAGGNEYVAEFKDNNAIAYGLKMGYRF